MDAYSIHFTVVDGVDDGDWSIVLKVANKGDGILIAEPQSLGRKIETRCKRIRDLSERGIYLVLAGGKKYAPSKADALISWMQSGGDKESKPRIAHNKTPEEKLKEAERYWTQQQFKRMTNGDIAETVQLSIPTMTRAFGKRSNYVKIKLGRPAE